MTCGLGLGILLICLAQAELVCCSLAKEAPRPKNSNTHAGFLLPERRRSKYNSDLQDQFRRGYISPRSGQSSKFNANPVVNSGYGRRLSTSSSTPLSKPAQNSRRLGERNLFSNWNRERTPSERVNAQSVPKQLVGPVSAVIRTSVSQSSKNYKEPFIDRKGTWSAQPRTGKSPKESYSSRPVSHLAAKREPLYKGQISLSATLFGPVAPGPHRSSVQMQTYAQAPARRVSPSPLSSLAQAKSLTPEIVAGKQHLYPQLALNAGGYRPKSQLQLRSLAVPSSRVGASAPGYAPVTVYELPKPFGGSAIRRLKLPVQKPRQVSSQQ